MEHAPTIDLNPAFGGSESDRLKVAMQIDSACRSTGFFVVIGHGVEETFLKNVIVSSREFFHLPISEKVMLFIRLCMFPKIFAAMWLQIEIATSLFWPEAPKLKDFGNF